MELNIIPVNKKEMALTLQKNFQDKSIIQYRIENHDE